MPYPRIQMHRSILHELLPVLPVLDVEQGQSVTLWPNPLSEHPLLALVRQVDGSISCERSIVTATKVPDPERGVDFFRFMHPNSWSTQGLAFGKAHDIVGFLLWDELDHSRDEYGNLRYSRSDMNLQIDDFLATLPPHPDQRIDDSAIKEAIIAGLCSMVKPAIFRLCLKKVPESIFLENYNIVARAEMHLHELIETNPGAVGWYYANSTIHRAGPEPHHSGQIVSTVRADLEHQGFDLANWKFFTALPAIFVAKIGQRRSPKAAAWLLNAISASHSLPGASPIDRAHHFLYSASQDQNTGATGRRNIAKLASILFRKSERGGLEQVDDLADVWDWVKHLDQNSQPLRAKTWQGCRRGSDRWHRQTAGETAGSSGQALAAAYHDITQLPD